MNANEIQHGGDHYKGSDYQHWDWAHDVKLAYLPGVASKYIYRWRKGSPEKQLLDLNKCDHYLDKCIETNEGGSEVFNRDYFFWKLVEENSMDLTDASVCHAIMEGQFTRAKELVKRLLANPDPKHAAASL